MADISQFQTHLSEELLLLQDLGFSDIYMHDSPAVFSYRTSDDSDTDSDLRLLEVIAAYLTTGNPGDVVAAAFDKREQICLVLAKSGTVGSADYGATHAFLSALRNADTWTDLYPFLATHCKQNVSKRVRNLHESLTELWDELQSAATDYEFRSMKREFPRSGPHLKVKYLEEPPTPPKFLHDLLHICVTLSTQFEMQDHEAALRQYVQLVSAAYSLYHSFFLTYLTGKYYERGDSKFKGRVERLKRRLDKVSQYARTTALIRLVKRLPNIPFRWVEDTLVGTGERILEICRNPMEVVERVLGENPPSAKQTEALLRHYPNLCKTWERRSRFVNTHVHPELRIILDLCRPLLSGLRPPLDDVAPLPVGCSKSSCLCCTVWINLFDYLAGMKCMIARTNGRPCDDWALPGAAAEMKEFPDWRYLDEGITQGGIYTSEKGGFSEDAHEDWGLAAG
ncbi:hypothetical protein Hypma_007328 [Hypsizygus marmoreus]|uniref:Uncharacterized protein n=1 Tax=Hypsizygus marmoreus TaxID=39966 RepID=A0A369K8K1_HYPMA|nr:hypothetical protein Hypma_007328 [Hypsizygus marmoreus]